MERSFGLSIRSVLFDRIGEENRKYLIVENGKVVSREISEKMRCAECDKGRGGYSAG